jgi:hypothetical protein
MNLINIRSGILVLLFISVSVLTLSVYFIHKEVRNMKMVLTKHTHDINSVFGVVGGVASGQMNHLPVVPEQPEQEEIQENEESSEEEDLVQVEHQDTVEVFENPEPENTEESIPAEDVNENVSESETSDSELENTDSQQE